MRHKKEICIRACSRHDIPMLRTISLSLILLLGSLLSAADQPNVVWIVSEDNSKHYLKLFDENGTETPNIAALAKDGLTFTRAFSNSPVCSVARTTLATGCLAPRIGTQFHRRSEFAKLPGDLRLFQAYLRDVGYYTSNNSKEDYNAIKSDDVWDDPSGKATWRNRSDGQPFFHMESHGQSHEGRLHFEEDTFNNVKTKHDPAAVTLPDYFPDTELFRYTYAHYLDCIQTIDGIVGDTVAKLEEDGVLEDTFIFYFGDHGGVLPRGKGYIYESGLHVPLVVRVPEKYKHLVSAERGTSHEGFVSFVDFAPTVLHLAGVTPPEEMDGKAFLGKDVSMKQVNKRNSTVGYADRFDEKYDLVRTLRIGDWKYMRSYQPYLPDGLQNNYRYFMMAYREWRDLYKEGKLGSAQRQFFEPKSAEMLFDVSTDPHEVNNLAGKPEHQARLSEMREKLQGKLLAMPDLGFFPESVLVDEAMENPVAYGQENETRIAKMIEIADLMLEPYDKIRGQLERTLNSSDEAHRYWAATVCAAFGKEASDLADTAKPLLNDSDPAVRIRAAEFLGLIGAADPRSTLIDVVDGTDHPVVQLMALNSVAFFHDNPSGLSYPFEASDFPKVKQSDEAYRRILYLGDDWIKKKPARKKNTKSKGKAK